MMKNRPTKRIFKCGCIEQSPSDVVFDYHNTARCAIHKAKMSGVELTCADCGQVEVRSTRAWAAEYCKACAKIRRNANRWGTRRHDEPIPEYDSEFILGHPWLTSNEIAAEIGYSVQTIMDYRKRLGLSGVEDWLSRFFETHIIPVIFKGGSR